MRTNTGKKYIKLRGDEVPTKDGEKRAAEFMGWYADNMERVRRCAAGTGFPVDDDLLTDTFITIHDAILYKGARIVNYTAYFLRAYKSRHINDVKKKSAAEFIPVTERVDLENVDVSEIVTKHREAVDTLNDEIMEYVRWTNDGVTAALFEIYMRLYPDVSYKKLSDLFGIPFIKVWSSIGKVRKNVDRLFRSRKDFLVSQVDF